MSIAGNGPALELMYARFFICRGRRRRRRPTWVTPLSLPHSTTHPSQRAMRLQANAPVPPMLARYSAKRRSNLALVPRKASSGSAPTCRARLTTANSRSPVSSASSSASPRIERGFNLVRFLANFVQHRVRIVPVEADGARPFAANPSRAPAPVDPPSRLTRAIRAELVLADAARRARLFPRP